MIVAVTGGKGGVGKSTVAFNLGREFDAVVVDGDLAMADLPRSSGPDLHDVLAGRASPLEAVTRAGSVRLLPCGRSLAGARATDLTAFGSTLDAIAREFGNVVVDCPAGLASDVGVQLHAADAAVLVTTPDDAALAAAVRTRELALGLETPIAGVVLNRVDGEDRAEAVERGLGAPVTVVPERDVVARAQSAGRPVRAVAPEAEVTERLASLAERLDRCEPRQGVSGRSSRSA